MLLKAVDQWQQSNNWWVVSSLWTKEANSYGHITSEHTPVVSLILRAQSSLKTKVYKKFLVETKNKLTCGRQTAGLCPRPQTASRMMNLHGGTNTTHNKIQWSMVCLLYTSTSLISIVDLGQSETLRFDCFLYMLTKRLNLFSVCSCLLYTSRCV